MRGIETGKTRIRHAVFTEIARMAYEGGDYARKLEELPYKICPGEPDEMGPYRTNVLIERAVVGQRLRLAMGLPTSKLGEYNTISDDIDKAALPESYYEPPLINVIKFACNRCPDNIVKVTDCCQGCLEHPCMEVCPRKAISKINGKAHINQDLCIKCGRCVQACPFTAIVKQVRPCKRACGVNAIGKDELGRATIDYKKCTACGQCLANCPFGAISDKSQIFQTISTIKSGVPVYAALAPAFVGQFGKDATPDKMRGLFKQLGFTDVYEVAIGADLCVIEEAQDFLKEVPTTHKFMATSCCPSWCDMVRKMFPDMADNISVAMTPMVLTARLIKEQHPESKVVFVGPCDAKKLEARRTTVRSDVDFVLTFEEVLGMFEAKGIDKDAILAEADEPLKQAGTDGRNFAVTGGVAGAVVNAIKRIDPTREVKVVKAAGLSECRKLLLEARAGKWDGYLLEGMACPNGCISGAGTLKPFDKSAREVAQFADSADFSCSYDTEYKEYLPLIEADAKNDSEIKQ